jgi:triosephosphate isomerase
MIRTPIIAGNWKCNMRLSTAFDLANSIASQVAEVDGVETILCPPFVYLATVETAITMSGVRLGAQDTHWEDDVAATGEVGPQQLEELVDYVIIGHSERRHVFGETDEEVNRKVASVLGVGIAPIMCIGETLEQREAGETDAVLTRQVRAGLDGTEIPEGFVVAYEPVWAIGTGRAATVDDADAAISLARSEIAAMFGQDKAETVRILYGGSVTPDNIAGFLERESIDGGLVGGASLNADAFSQIVRTAAQVRDAA